MKNLIASMLISSGLLAGCTSDTTDKTTSVHYANCKAAKDAGATPLHKGEPGYRSELDRDGDGVACDA